MTARSKRENSAADTTEMSPKRIACGAIVLFNVPVLWAVGSLLLLIVDDVTNVTGILHANASIDRSLHETTYLITHAHYGLRLAVIFTVFAALYYGFPKVTGYMYNETLARLHFLITFVGVNLSFLPQRLLGLTVMPRHFVDYPEALAFWSKWALFGSYMAGFGVLVFLYTMVDAFIKKQRTDDNS